MAKTLVIKGADFSQNYIEQVSFSDVPCTGIMLNKNTITLENTTDTDTLIPTLVPANTTDAVIWLSSDNDIAKVVNGVVSAVGIGTVTITAQCGEFSATCSVTCVGKIDFFASKGAYLDVALTRNYATLNSTSATNGFTVGLEDGTLKGTDVESADGWIYPIIVPKNAKTICCRCMTQYWGIRTIAFMKSNVESSKEGVAFVSSYINGQTQTGWGDKTYNGVACWGNDIPLPTDVEYDSVIMLIRQYGSAVIKDADVTGTHLWFETT